MSPLLVITLAGGALYLLTQSSTSSQAWPPSPGVQQGLVTQLSTYYQSATGNVPGAAEVTQIQAAVNGAPAQYQASLPQGTAPTIAGYQAWVLSKGQAAMQVVSATTAGPLGLHGGDPYPMWDVHGNAYFRQSDGSVVATYHSRDQRGDFPSPRSHDFRAELWPGSSREGW
jgi:hypothetical protein